MQPSQGSRADGAGDASTNTKDKLTALGLMQGSDLDSACLRESRTAILRSKKSGHYLKTNSLRHTMAGFQTTQIPLQVRMAGFNWIDELPAAVRADVLSLATVRKCKNGELIYQQGDITSQFFQVISGKVRQFIVTSDGQEVLVYLYGRGDVVGDSAVLDRSPYPVSIACEGPTRLHAWSLATFGELRRRHPEIDIAIALQTSRRMRAFLDRIVELCTLPTPARIVSRLLSLARTTGQREIKVSQADLALKVGATRQSVNEVIVELRSRGLLSTHYGTITLHDLNGLADFLAAFKALESRLVGS